MAISLLAYFSWHIVLVLLVGLPRLAAAGNKNDTNMNDHLELSWGDGRGKILNNGQLLTLSLDKNSGSGFQSKDWYLFGKIEMQIKLVPGNSAGTVTTFYLHSLEDSQHDEIDFEFLGNVSGQPYTLHTNVYTLGNGTREQQFHLWFDPTADFHTYTILWNPQRIVFMVDNIPIREFKNSESKGVAFPKSKAMRMYSTLWDGEQWATQGGRVKTDWSKAPFTASYKNYKADACVWSSGSSSCDKGSKNSSISLSSSSWFDQGLDNSSQKKMKLLQKKYMIYNYCSDVKRFPQGLPPECALPA